MQLQDNSFKIIENMCKLQ